MTTLTWTYLTYLAVCGGAVWWVARTLKRNGVVVLLDGAPRKSELAAAVSDLLVVGFYLVNLGFISFALTASTATLTLEGAIELLSTKVGLVLVVLVVLGVVHFLSVGALALARSATRGNGHRRTLEVEKLL